MKKVNMEGKQFPDLNEAIKQGKTTFGFIVHESGTEVICNGVYGELMNALAYGVATAIADAETGSNDEAFSVQEEIDQFSTSVAKKLIEVLIERIKSVNET